MIKVHFIDVGFDHLKTILHMADIHVRNLRRHKEYEKVFQKIYVHAKKLPKESIIYIGGDIAHAKTQMSPELIRMISNFLRTLADIRPTIFVLGNHDLNLNNRNRLDALSPIVNNLKHPNLHFLKESGIYEIADVSFVVMSVFDEPENFIKAKDVNGKTKIALFHGIIANSKTDFGFVLDSNVKISIFKGYDMALLGDLHRQQYMNNEKTIAYCGSCLQQSHGEILNKGFLLWDIPSRTSKFIEIKNDRGFYTLYIDNGVVPDVSDMPKYANLRIRTINTEPSELKLAIAEIRTKYGIKKITISRMDTLSQQKSGDRKSLINIGNISEPKFQFQLIKDYLERNYSLDDSIVTKINNINKDLNDSLPDAEISRNIIWKLKKFEFENMFSYGKGNVIDFEKLNGIVGIFSPNSTGKSSYLDSLTFCLFDTCSRAFKAIHILNNKKKNFWCKVNFEMNGYDYFIERKAITQASGKVKVSVDFTMIDDTGDIISLNGDQRRSTNSNIKRIIGTYDDFVMTTLSVQNNFTVFIDKTQKERKELLADFMGIGIFDQLHSLAKDEISEVASVLKSFSDNDYGKELSDFNQLLKQYCSEYVLLEEKKNDLVDSKKVLDIKRMVLSKQLKPIDKSIIDIVKLTNDKDNWCKDLITIEADIKYNQNLKNENYKLKLSTQKIISTYIENKTDKKFNEFEKLNADRTAVKIEIDKLKISVRHKLEKLDKLHDLEYDPNCKFCMNNIFVIDAINTKKELKDDKIIAKKYIDNIMNLEINIEQIKSIGIDKEHLDSAKQKLIEIENKDIKLNSHEKLLIERKKGISSSILMVKEKITKHHQQKQNILINEKINLELNQFNSDIEEVEHKIGSVEYELTTVHGEQKVVETKIQAINNTIKKIEKLESEYEAYEYYLDAINRNGIPYELITQILPTIEGEINNILAQIVDFNIKMEMDGKNINTFLVYDEDNIWPLELCGGMEKFISSLAIRIGLINVSNLPRTNFLIIDEGFSALDEENFNSLYMLFQYIKIQFNFMLIISHLESMRDIVDIILDINKVNGYSTISNIN